MDRQSRRKMGTPGLGVNGVAASRPPGRHVGSPGELAAGSRAECVWQSRARLRRKEGGEKAEKAVAFQSSDLDLISVSAALNLAKIHFLTCKI